MKQGDGLGVVDVQNDFLSGSILAIPRGDEVVHALNRHVAAYA